MTKSELEEKKQRMSELETQASPFALFFFFLLDSKLETHADTTARKTC